MADIPYYFKRKYRKGNSESSEDSLKSPEDKKARTIRSPGSESDDILEALDMAEGVMPKIELILSRLAILEDKMDGIEKHMRNVDERVSRLYEKVSTLELCLNGHDELVRSVEAKVTSYIADADKMKSDISTLNKNVKSAEEKILNYEADVAKANGEMASLRKQLQYMETYQRRENLRFYGIPEQSEGKENSREVLVDFFKNNLGIDDAESIELQRVHRIGKYDSEQTKPRQMIARFLRYPEREEVFSKAGRLKGTGLGISADLPKSIVEARKKLISKFKAAKKDGKTAFFSRAEPDKLYINGVLISP